MEIKVKDRQKLLLIIAVVALVLIIGNKVVYEPIESSWEDRNALITKLQGEVKADNELLQKRDQILKHWDYMSDSVLPANTSLAGGALLAAKDKWVRNSGLNLDDFSPQLKTEADSDGSNVITSWECRADASGNMHSLLSFLWEMESDHMGLQLEDIEISSKDNNGNGPQMALGITLGALVLDNNQTSTP